MLTIRTEQMEAFRCAALRSFETDMVAHLAEFSPPLFNAVKEDQMRKTIRLGIHKADGYGLTFRGPVRLYLELMLLFGSSFDTDSQYPWAAEILTDRDSGDQMQRAERLYERTCDYRKRVNGPEDAYTLDALRNLAVFAEQPLALPSDDFVPAIEQKMAQLYPEKTAYIGSDNLGLLIDESMATARDVGFSGERAVTLIVILMFAFGHGCCDDPLYPWIANTLHDPRIVDRAAQAKRLEAKALTWLEHVLARFEGAGEDELSI